MVYGVIFGDKHSFKDWRLLLNERPKISTPTAKTNYIDIPGGDGKIDLTETLSGDVKFNTRTMEFVFLTTKARKKWPNLYSDIQDYLHGQKMKIVLDEEPCFYYIGRVSVDEWKSLEKYSTIAIKAEVAPYKYERYGSLEPWVWDTFCFESGIIRNYKDLEVDGTMMLVIPGRRKKVVPVLECSSEMGLEYGGRTYRLPAGRTKIIDLQLGMGEHYLTFTGTGTVSVDYRGASL